MKLISICKIYDRLLADLAVIEKLKPVDEEEVALCLSLKQSNAENLEALKQQIKVDFPEVCSDLDGWSENDIRFWFHFLHKHPVFFADRLVELICLFYNLERSSRPKPDDRKDFIMYVLMQDATLRLFVSDNVYLLRCLEDLISEFADSEQRRILNRKIIQLQSEV